MSSISGRTWGVLLVLCGAIFLEGIDIAMLNVALPSIRAELGLSTAVLSGVVSAYVLGYGGFMLLGGRAADLFGRRRMFLFWLAVFVVFSGLGGLATDGWMLLLARFATGVAAAFMTPAGLSIITTSFDEGPARNKALLVYAGTGAGGFTLGLVMGGLLTAIGWRWVFFAPVILAIAILLGAWLLIEKTERPQQKIGFDIGGAISLTSAMLLLVYAVVSLEQPSAWTAVAFVAGLILLGIFVAVERKSAAPLVRLGVLRSGALVRANLGAVLFAGGFFGFQFLITLCLQELRGWSTIQTGLAMLVAGGDAILAPTLTPWLVATFGNVRVILGGTVAAALAYALFLPVGMDWTYAAMFPTMVLIGLGFALAYGPLTIAGTDGVVAAEQGLAGGLLNTSFQFGAALGLSLVTAVLGAGQAQLDAFRNALLVPVAAALIAALVTAFGLRTRTKAVLIQR